MCEWPAVASEAGGGGRENSSSMLLRLELPFRPLGRQPPRRPPFFLSPFKEPGALRAKRRWWPPTRLPACLLPRPTTQPLSAKIPAEKTPRKQPRKPQSCRQERGNYGGQAVPAGGKRWSQKLGQLARSNSGDVWEWKWGGYSKIFGVSELFDFFKIWTLPSPHKSCLHSVF